MTAVATERRIAALCWCERVEVMVPVQWISEARTGSCGPNCGPGCPAYGEADEDNESDPTEVARNGKKGKMNRFKADRYDPRADSSFGYANGGVRTEYIHDVILETEGNDPRFCPCGCAEAPRGKTAVFGMGHDARLRGKLARALAGGSRIVLTDTNHAVCEVLEPTEMASRFSTEKLDWVESIKTSAKKAKRSAADTAEEAILQKALGPQVGDTKLIKIGRWEYTGSIVAIYETDGATEFEYADKGGSVHRVRQSADGKFAEVAVA